MGSLLDTIDPETGEVLPSKLGGPKPVSLLDSVDPKTGAVLPPPKAAAAKDEDPGFFDTLWRHGLQGASFNGSDEAIAAARALRGEKFSDALASEQEKVAAGHKYWPKTAILSELGGSLLPMTASLFTGGVATPVAAASTAQKASLAARALKTLWGGAKPGLIYGGASGFLGTDHDKDKSLVDNVTDRVRGGVGGATVGGAVGAVLPPLINGGVQAVRKGYGTTLGSQVNPKAFSDRKVAEALRAEGAGTADPIETVRQRVKAMADVRPEALVGDAMQPKGPVHRNARAAGNIGNTETPVLAEKMRQRALGEGPEIESAWGKHLGDPNAYEPTLAKLEAEHTTLSKDAYDHVRAGSFEPHADLTEIMARKPTGKATYADALADPVPVLGKSAEARILDKAREKITGDLENDFGRSRIPAIFEKEDSLPYAHRVRMYLDKQIKSAEKNASGYSDDKASLASLQSLRNRLDTALKASGGEGPKRLIQADAEFGKRADVIKALERGRADGAQMEQGAIKHALSTMSPEEASAYKLGLSREYQIKNDRGNEIHDKLKTFASANDRKVRAATMDPQGQKEFEDLLEAIGKGHAFKGALEGNSTSASQLKALQEFSHPAEDAVGHGEAVVDLLRGKVGKAIGRYYGKGRDFLTMGLNGEVAKHQLQTYGRKASDIDAILAEIAGADQKYAARSKTIEKWSTLVPTAARRGGFALAGSPQPKDEKQGAFRK